MSEYWKDWPKKGKYVEDLQWAAKVGIQFLRQLAQRKNTANCYCIFDVDETIVFGDPEECIGVREMELGEHGGQTVFVLPPNPPIVTLVHEAKRLGYKIIILTARPKCSRLATITNLEMFKIPYDNIIMNNMDEDPAFKIRVRKQLAAKYNIVLSVGDQATDVLLPGKCAIIKLPEPELKAAYAHVPSYMLKS